MKRKDPLDGVYRDLKPECSNGISIHPIMKRFMGYCLMKVAHRFRSSMDEKLTKLGLVAPQVAVMTLLKEVGPLTQIEIGQSLMIDKATMVRFLDGLEKGQYVTRESHHTDRRAKILKITKVGEKILDQVREIRQEVEDQVLEPLTVSERKTLRELIAKVVS